MIPDLKNFTKKKLSPILHNVMKEWDSKWTSITELSTLNEFYGEIAGRLWEKTLNYCKSINPTTDPCSAEEVVAAIIRKGLKKESIIFRGTSFILSLPNHAYEIKKYGEQFNARPLYGMFSYQKFSSRWITMEKEAFADFLFEFDSVLPQVKERISNCTSAWMPHIMRQCRIAEEINTLAEKYLMEEGIKCEVKSFKNGSPMLRFSKGKTLPMVKIVVPEELEEFFREVPELMSIRTNCNNNKLAGRDSDIVSAFFNWESSQKD